MGLLVIFRILVLLYVSSLSTCAAEEEDISSIIAKRQDRLRRIANSIPRPPCSSNKVIFVEDYAYGRSGNNMLELVHGIYLAQATNTSLRIPFFMNTVLASFHHDSLTQNFCATNNGLSRFLYFRSVELLNVWMMFKFDKYRNHFPPLTQDVVNEAASLYIRIMASLWASPIDVIVEAGKTFIKNKLGNSLKYTTVHKRYMEGECPDIFRRMSNKTDFSPDELPMDHPSWNALSNLSHPLCSMNLDFIQQTQAINHRSNQQIFLAYDGYGDISHYLKAGAAVLTDADLAPFPQFRDHPECQQKRKCFDNRKFLDMFLAIHGDFFVLNPRSTYSWYVFVVRTALGLKSVPMVRNRDLLFYSDKDYEVLMDGKRWVGHYDIARMMNSLENLIKSN
jgi:hypothetical protein